MNIQNFLLLVFGSRSLKNKSAIETDTLCTGIMHYVPHLFPTSSIEHNHVSVVLLFCKSKKRKANLEKQDRISFWNMDYYAFGPIFVG